MNGLTAFCRVSCPLSKNFRKRNSLDYSVFVGRKGMKRTLLLNAFFTLVFSGKTNAHESQVSEASGKVWSKEYFLLMEEDHVMELLNKLNLHKLMELDGIQPQLLRKLADVIAKSLLTIFERSWCGWTQQYSKVPSNLSHSVT